MSSHRGARPAESADRGHDGHDGADRAAPSLSPQRGDGAAEYAAATRRVRSRSPSRRDDRHSAAAPLVFEAWGVHVVAMIVYWCCIALEESTDAFKKAADVANAFWEEQVCGSGLAELLRRDASRGDLLLASVLPKPGSRASVLGALRSYISAHGHEERPVASEADARLLSFPLSASDNAPAPAPAALPSLGSFAAHEPADQTAPPRSLQYGDGAAASAAAAPPLAFETWDRKAVATVVYRCCKALDAGIRKNAADVADAFWKAQVTGRALAEILRYDASSHCAWLADVLPEHGSRATVFGELRAYVSAHGDEERPVESESDKDELSFPLSASHVPHSDDERQAGQAAVASSSFDRFKPVACPGEFGKLSLATYLIGESTFYSEKRETSATMPMPLWATMNIKELQEEIGNADKVLMIGTLVIRSMFDTDLFLGVDGKQSPRPSLKVNGSEVTDEQLRLLSSEVEHIRGGPHCFMRTTTYSLEVATKRRNVFAKAPFNITSFQVSLDFLPLVARLPKGELIKFMPDLLCPIDDLRHLGSVEDDGLDSLDKFDIINPNPSVEVKVDSDAGYARASSMKFTFYGDTDAVRAALNIIVPILFIAFGNVLNVWFSEDHDNFVANALTLGLTFVFFIPTLNQVESVSNELDLNQLLVVLIFLGLVLGCMDCKRCNGGTNHLLPLHFKTLRSVVRATSFTLLWGSVLIPVLNLILYRRVKWRLRGAAYGRGRGFYSSGGSHLKGSWFTGRPDLITSKMPSKYLARGSVRRLQCTWKGSLGRQGPSNHSSHQALPSSSSSSSIMHSTEARRSRERMVSRVYLKE
ncbi:hypothetical protein M885DRAFT_525056 [Pelagophyceae sp. CCMP2097]|nr:hypothetical protein M885DRAFT_525056 [Pelagophyceae sp. CCMP2097]